MEETIVSRASADLVSKLSGFGGDNLGRPPPTTNVHCPTRRRSPVLDSADRGPRLMAYRACLGQWNASP